LLSLMLHSFDYAAFLMFVSMYHSERYLDIHLSWCLASNSAYPCWHLRSIPDRISPPHIEHSAHSVNWACISFRSVGFLSELSVFFHNIIFLLPLSRVRRSYSGTRWSNICAESPWLWSE
jgi:hypothetical protein